MTELDRPLTNHASAIPDRSDRPAILLKGVTKRFGGRAAVRSLDLSVPRGSLCGFLGPNGAGKSTTIRMIMSIIVADEGQVEVLGASALAAKDRIGYLPEERGVYRKMRVAEFLEYIGRLKGMRSREVRNAVERWLARVELPGVATLRCSDLSKGLQQKVQFIAALINEPELVILDEPFSGLDPVSAGLMRGVIEEVRRAGRTILFSTHVMHQAEALCDRVILMHHGTKRLDATLPEIRSRFDPRMLVLEPMVDDREATRSLAMRLGVMPCVEQADVTDDGTIEVRLVGADAAQEVVRAAVDASACRRIELRRASLEEVFVSIVRRQEGDDAAAAAREELAAAEEIAVA